MYFLSYVNIYLGIDHLPGPDAHDIQYSVSSIPQLEGQLLEVAGIVSLV